MMKLLAFLWSGCWHRWKIIGRSNVFEHGRGPKDALPVNIDFTLQCERCGTVRRKRT